MALYYDPVLRDFVWQTDVQQHILMHTTPVYNQDHFRFRSDTGGVDATPTWLANEDTSVTLSPDDIFRLRIGLQEAAGGDTTSNLEFTLQASYNSGTYFDVTASSDYVQGSTSASSSADGTAIATGRLAGLTGTLATGSSYEDDGAQATNSVTINANENMEVEFGLIITSAATNNVSDGDTLDFRIVQSGGTTLDNYNATPRVTASVPTTGTIDATLGAVTQSVSGTYTPLDATGTIDATLGTVTQAATGGQTFSGTITATLTAVTQSVESTILEFLRPNADVTDGSWTNELGNNTNLFASIDEETANDSDYIRSSDSPTNDTAEVALSDPSGGTVASGAHIVRYRYRAVGSTDMNLTVALYEGGTEIASWTHNNVGTGYVDQSQTLTAPQVASITDYTNLRLRFTANRP